MNNQFLKRPVVPVREMDELGRDMVREMFKRIIKYDLVSKDLGLEGTEEALENLYDLGIIKFSLEPFIKDHSFIMLFDDNIGAYRFINKLSMTAVK